MNEKYLHLESLKSLLCIILLPSLFSSESAKSFSKGFSFSPFIGITEWSKRSSRNDKAVSEKETYFFNDGNSILYIRIHRSAYVVPRFYHQILPILILRCNHLQLNGH